jgi:hypothetical protein
VSFQAPNLLYSLMFRHRARSTHHKIALSALLHLEGKDAAAWRDLFLLEADPYLRGAKAPDDVFRDSMNQVLHVRDNYWGGAPEAAESWYSRLVERLRARAWSDAAFAAGVLSHYWSDPIQPLHTGQTEAEGPIHRALEQSIAKSWDDIIAKVGAVAPKVAAQEGPGWLTQMVREGAERASPFYDLCIDHYNLDAGSEQPKLGLDQALKDALAQCLGHAVGGFAVILGRAFAEAKASPPTVNLTLGTVLEIIGLPIQTVLAKIEDADERAIVKIQLNEFRATGKVIKTLSHDDRIVRAAHARHILGIEIAKLDAQPARSPGALYGQPATQSAPAAKPTAVAPATKKPDAPVQTQSTQRPLNAPERLPLEAPVEDAPAIGPMTATRLNAIGCVTVADLLALIPQAAADALEAKHISADDIRRWQTATRLYRSIRTLNQTEAQLLAALGIDSLTALQRAEPEPLAGEIAAFAATPAGQRIIRNAPAPSLGSVQAWIDASRLAS